MSETINLSILDFKRFRAGIDYVPSDTINLSILDFKPILFSLTTSDIIFYKSIHIGF